MFAQIFINNSEYLNSKHETVNFSNRPQQRPVKSLTRGSDKDAGARNSYSSDWKDRNWRKLKGDAKNDDVEKRWREISKVGGVEVVITFYLSDLSPHYSESGQHQSEKQEPRAGGRDRPGRK